MEEVLYCIYQSTLVSVNSEVSPETGEVVDQRSFFFNGQLFSTDWAA